MNERRRAIAERYRGGLSGLPGLLLPPSDSADTYSVYHLFVVRTEKRDRLRDALAGLGIGTQIHYPIPAHLQDAFPEARPSLPATERIVSEILSLPIYPELSDAAVDEVIFAIRRLAVATE
jgi:dTDP-4-amino-4,6-dideoxygalactose transaminase